MSIDFKHSLVACVRAGVKPASGDPPTAPVLVVVAGRRSVTDPSQQ